MTVLKLKPSQIVISLLEGFSNLTIFGMDLIERTSDYRRVKSDEQQDKILELTFQNLADYPINK